SGLPVACGMDPGPQGAIVQHRQIEPRAVPGDQVRSELLDAVIEPLDQLGFRRARIPEAPHTQPLPAAQHAGDRNHTVLLETQELPARRIATQREHGFRHLLLAQPLQVVQPPAQIDVRNGLDVEDENVHQRAATMSAFMSRTAVARPSNTARAMIACPMLSSTTSRSEAMGCTL